MYADAGRRATVRGGGANRGELGDIWGIQPFLFHTTLIKLRRGDPRGRRHLTPPAERPVARRGRGLAGRHPDRDAVRPEPPRPLAHEARGHEAEHLELSVKALDRLADRTIEWVAGGGGRVG